MLGLRAWRGEGGEVRFADDIIVGVRGGGV